MATIIQSPQAGNELTKEIADECTNIEIDHRFQKKKDVEESLISHF